MEKGQQIYLNSVYIIFLFTSPQSFVLDASFALVVWMNKTVLFQSLQFLQTRKLKI